MATSTSVHDVTRVTVASQVSSCESSPAGYCVQTYTFWHEADALYEVTIFAPEGQKEMPIAHMGK